jgi:hypothetical protein
MMDLPSMKKFHLPRISYREDAWAINVIKWLGGELNRPKPYSTVTDFARFLG